MSVGLDRVNENIEKLSLKIAKEKEKKRKLMQEDRLRKKKQKQQWLQRVGEMFDVALSAKYPNDYYIGMEEEKLQAIINKVVKNDVTGE